MLKQTVEDAGTHDHGEWVADNDDYLPDEIIRIIDALARAAARRDHYASINETANRD